MQLKGLALKKTPIDADSAVSRHERLDEGENCEKRVAQNAECKMQNAKKEKGEAMTSIFNPTPFATCLSVGALPNVDRCHARF